MRDRLLAIDPWFLLVLPVFIGIYTTARAVVSRFLGGARRASIQVGPDAHGAGMEGTSEGPPPPAPQPPPPEGGGL